MDSSGVAWRPATIRALTMASNGDYGSVGVGLCPGRSGRLDLGQLRPEAIDALLRGAQLFLRL